MTKLALQQAIDLVGGQSALARLLGKKQAHVWWWLHKSKRVPAEVACSIEAATAGQITREALRPDIFTPSHHSLPSQETKVGS
ncbi:helix-turn-helix domain-containing protein [Asaia lannensis]|uniref:helix-turn-helix domain-containing protein n=1 Tax=Asaia lannensis TaxID=415421 RepID=UPI003873B6C5